jgi:hypothetical protein
MTLAHEVDADGESTAKWAIREPDFLGTLKQLTCCARCGERLPPGPNVKRKVFDMFKPSMHVLCDPCFDALPN